MRLFLIVCSAYSFSFLLLTRCTSPQQSHTAAASPMTPYYIAGEPDQHSIILHARLNTSFDLVGQDLAGLRADGYFEVSEDSSFANAYKTEWLSANSKNDYILKTLVANLKPGTRYYYRAVYGPLQSSAGKGPIATFSTLPDTLSTAPFSFIVASCMNYERFLGLVPLANPGERNPWAVPAAPQDSALGYPAFDVILRQYPAAFWVGNGDNVYYDVPKEQRAKTEQEMRAKWHRLFAFPRTRNFLAQVPTYWTKDDHDFRNNDCDTTNEYFTEPSNWLGKYIFREQVPITFPVDPSMVNYRTHRVNQDLQIWFTEGREHRTPLSRPDGPDKSLWGAEQLAWLKRTLKESDATFKIIVSPTPMVGPDDHRLPGDTITLDKRDNHADIGGYRHEGDAFFSWLQSNGLGGDQVFIINGDRHWQYHSIHPSGIHEFCTGAFVAQNARLGRKPGEPNSSDPEGRVRQPYIQEKPSGGFVRVSTEGATQPGQLASIHFQIIEETGKPLHTYSAKRVR
ncbi:MAG: alkaline phosphatase D family protein [Bacteroidia bacterium]|nr:alkaline phosphatase D family protein [Bacteroidia bacterium]